MSQSSAAKPSLQGVRIKARKGAVKAQAKHEPTIFRDQLYKHLELVPEGDFDGFASKLAQAGSTLEFLKYADALFEIMLVGGLLQPGGTYIEDGAPMSPFTIFKAKEPAEIDEIKKYIDVLNKLIRRYKYLQRPLEDSVLPGLLQYIHRWPEPQRDKLALTTGLLIAQGLASASCLQSLSKDHLLKNDVSVNVITLIFKAYLVDQSIDHLATALRRGGIKDITIFFPARFHADKGVEDHFKKAGLPQVAEWWSKKQYAVLKEEMLRIIKEKLTGEDSPEQAISAIRHKQEEKALPEIELVQVMWQAFIGTVDWNVKPDQLEKKVVQDIGDLAPILEPFCNGAKTEVALINVVQVHCYEDTRIIKAFPQILKVLYNKDCVSDQAIIYWHQKGAKPQGKQHFQKVTEPLVKFLQEQEEESEEEGEE